VLFSRRFQARQSVQLREIAVAYELDNESVVKAFAEFQPLGMVRLSGNSSAIVRSQNPDEIQEAYEVRAAIDQGRDARFIATVNYCEFESSQGTPNDSLSR
jgi:DNA-binding GntR family transcriptional regulator